MNIGLLKERIADIPDNYEVQLQSLIAMVGEGDDQHQIRFHDPIIGIAVSDEHKEAVFVMSDPNLQNENIDFFERMADDTS